MESRQSTAFSVGSVAGTGAGAALNPAPGFSSRMTTKLVQSVNEKSWSRAEEQRARLIGPVQADEFPAKSELCVGPRFESWAGDERRDAQSNALLPNAAAVAP